jgi:hypothetical protein
MLAVNRPQSLGLASAAQQPSGLLGPYVIPHASTQAQPPQVGLIARTEDWPFGIAGLMLWFDD